MLPPRLRSVRRGWDAVSYTHLDVYKRKHLHRAHMGDADAGGHDGVQFGLPLGKIRAVSYTHLDVYKRQTGCRPHRPAPRTGWRFRAGGRSNSG